MYGELATKFKIRVNCERLDYYHLCLNTQIISDTIAQFKLISNYGITCTVVSSKTSYYRLNELKKDQIKMSLKCLFQLRPISYLTKSAILILNLPNRYFTSKISYYVLLFTISHSISLFNLQWTHTNPPRFWLISK